MTTIWVNTIRLMMGEVRVIEEVIDTLGNSNGVELFKILNEKIQYNSGTSNSENIIYVQMIDSQKLMRLGMNLSRVLKETKGRKLENKSMNDFIGRILTMLTSSVYINNIGNRGHMARGNSIRGNRTPSISSQSTHETNPSQLSRTILTSNYHGPDSYLPDNRLILRNVLNQLKLCMIFMIEALQSMESQEEYELLEPQISSFLLLVNVSIVDKLYKLFKQLDRRFVLNTEKFINAITKS